MASGFLIRRFEAPDRDAVWRLHKLAVAQAEAFAADDYFADLNDVESVYLRDRGEFLVGSLDGHVVAMGAFQPRSDDVAEILRMRVDPAFQRAGLGRALLNALETRARQSSFKLLKLQTTVVQVAAQRFYESQGYVKTGRGNAEGYEVIRYEKRIESSGDGGAYSKCATNRAGSEP